MFDSSPFVSIVVPVKNEAMYIGRCINSLVCQEYPRDHYQIIVVDNGSKDYTCEIVESYLHSHNIELYHFDGETISSVRNHGASMAKGSILAFLDGDCEAPSQWLISGLELIFSDKNIGCVGFVAAEPEEAGTWVEKAWFHINSRGRFVGTVQKDWLSSFNLILRREIFHEVGGFDESLMTCEDADLGYRIGVNHKLLISDQIKIRHLGESKTVKDFYRKEIWRGTSNLSSFFRSSNKKKDFFSTFVPPVYVLLHLILCLIFITTLFADTRLISVLVSLIAMIVALPVFITLKKSKQSTGVFEFLEVSFLLYLYLIARGLAIFNVTTQKTKMKNEGQMIEK